MVNEPAQFIESLERQLILLRELAGEMRRARAALASMNLEGIYEHSARQSELCERIQAEQENRNRMQSAASTKKSPMVSEDIRGWLNSLDAETSQRIRRMLLDLATVAREISEANQVQTRLIQGTRRTLQVLGNTFASFAPTYSLPLPAAHSPRATAQP